MWNDAEFYKSYEIIGGEKFMAPAAPVGHSGILFRLGLVLGNYVVSNKCGYVFLDDVDVHLPDGNLFKPDMVVITAENAGIINWHGAIYGVPDMVVEVLSKSTKRNDRTIKKDSYETCGVKEYWIIDPFMQSVDVYILRDGKFELGDEYILYDDYEWETLNDEKKAAAKFEIKLSIFEDCIVNLHDIFAWGFNNAIIKA